MLRAGVIILLFSLKGFGQFSLDKIFTDNMVLQRDKPIAVYGKGDPGTTVRILMGDAEATAAVGMDSSWIVGLPPLPFSGITRTLMAICGSDTTMLRNIIMGDVWVCIGQSNMEWPMEKEMFYRQAIDSAGSPYLRFYNPTYAGKSVFASVFSDSIVRMLSPAFFYKGKWQESDSVSFRTMSAVAYYFGRHLQSATGIPMGLIHLSIGGAPLETFIDRDAISSDPRFSSKVGTDWLANDALPVWVRERGRQNVGSVDAPLDIDGKNHAFKPGFAYESGIRSLHSFPVKGVICYQGESNAQEIDRVMEYAELTECMVRDYRNKWRDSSLPFYFVQLSSIDTFKYKGQLWGLFRDQQRLLQQRMPYSGMAVSSDRGHPEDVHPRNKRDIGIRLALWASHEQYEKGVVPSGPLPLSAKYSAGKISLAFAYAKGGLFIKEGGELRGFSFDGVNEEPACIVGDKVEILISGRPNFVYYGWKSFSDGNLTNAEGLPASTFRIPIEYH
jgi:sialate O-acetylesterase